MVATRTIRTRACTRVPVAPPPPVAVSLPSPLALRKVWQCTMPLANPPLSPPALSGRRPAGPSRNPARADSLDLCVSRVRHAHHNVHLLAR